MTRGVSTLIGPTGIVPTADLIFHPTTELTANGFECMLELLNHTQSRALCAFKLRIHVRIYHMPLAYSPGSSRAFVRRPHSPSLYITANDHGKPRCVARWSRPQLPCRPSRHAPDRPGRDSDQECRPRHQPHRLESTRLRLVDPEVACRAGL